MALPGEAREGTCERPDMEGNAYLDFDLRFTKSENGYCAETLQSPGGSGQHGFRLPFQEHELENYLLKIGQPVKIAYMRGGKRVETMLTPSARK